MNRNLNKRTVFSPQAIPRLLNADRAPVSTVSLNKQGSIDEAVKWIMAHLSPGTANIDGVRIPTGLTVPTAAIAKNSSYDLSPDANGNVLIFMLPFLEAPLAKYDTATGVLTVIQDTALGAVASDGQDYMKNGLIYGFRCCFQSLTIENNTNELHKQGTCIASLMPAQIDNHEIEDAAGRRYLRVVDNLPTSAQAISSSVKTPYTGLAKDGCYIVNRNHTGDWNMINRDSDWNKATTTVYALDQAGTGVAATGVSRRNALAYRPDKTSAIKLASLTAQQGAFANTLATDTTVAVSGQGGTNYGIGAVLFTNQVPEASFRVKLIHGYEFALKPDALWTTITMPPPFAEEWAFKAVCMQLSSKLTIYPADANFWGAILRGLSTVLPYVMPVVEKVLPSIGNWIGAKTKQVVKPAHVVEIGSAGMNKIAALVNKAAQKK